MLAELEKIMTVMSLQHVINTLVEITIEINTLVEITQEYLNEKFNLYTRNIASSERLLEEEVLQNANIGIHANLLEDESAIADSNIDANLQKDDLVTKSSTIQNFVLDHNSAISENAPIGVTQKESNSNSYVDFDELHKLTSTEVIDSGEHCQKRETKYRYYSQSSIGHNISGPLPKLIDLTCFNQNKLFEVFALLFRSIESKRVIIHFEHENPSWLVNLLKR